MARLTLTAEEIHQLTGYRRYAEQVRELARRQIPHETTPNRKIVVIRSRVEAPSAEDEYRETPNFAAI